MKRKYRLYVFMLGAIAVFANYVILSMKTIPNRELIGLTSIHVQSATIEQYDDRYRQISLKERMRLSTERSKTIVSIVEHLKEHRSYKKQGWIEDLRFSVDTDLGQYLVTYSIGIKDITASIEYSGKGRTLTLSQEAEKEIRRFIEEYLEFSSSHP